MTDKPDDTPGTQPAAPKAPPGNVRDRNNDRAGSGGARDDGAGSPGGTRGTGGAADQDQ